MSLNRLFPFIKLFYKIKIAGKEQLVSEVFMFGWFGVDLGIEIRFWRASLRLRSAIFTSWSVSQREEKKQDKGGAFCPVAPRN